MKKIATTLIWVLAISTAFSQKGAFKNIELSLNFGLEEHGRQFFGQAAEDGKWTTHQFGFVANTNIFKRGGLTLRTGVGLAMETNTFKSAFDHCFDNEGGVCTSILAYFEKYHNLLFQVPVELDFNFIKNFGIYFGIIPQMSLFKSARFGNHHTSAFNPSLYSLEYVPGIFWENQKFRISLGYRVRQIKAIDQVYLYGNNFLVENPGYLDQKYETYNPTKLLLSFGYKLL